MIGVWDNIGQEQDLNLNWKKWQLQVAGFLCSVSLKSKNVTQSFHLCIWVYITAHTIVDIVFMLAMRLWFNAEMPGQNSHNFAEDIFKCNLIVLIEISLKSVPSCPIDNKSGLVQVMACYQTSNKQLPEPKVIITYQNWHFVKYVNLLVCMSVCFIYQHIWCKCVCHQGFCLNLIEKTHLTLVIMP